MRARPWLLLALALPSLALAQNFNFEGLDLAKPAKEKKEPPPEPPGPPPAMDHAEGDPVLVLPPRREGRLDLDAYRVLFGALAERLGGRLVPADATLKAIEKEKLAARLAQPDAQRKLSLLLKADLVVHFEGGTGKVEARLHPGPGERPAAEVSVPLARGRKLALGPARALVAELLARGEATLQAPAALDLTAGAPTPAPEPAPAAPEEAEDVARIASGVKEAAPQGPLMPAALLAYAGGGAGFRSLQAGAGLVQNPTVPVSPAAMASLAVDVQVYPLRWVKALADGPWADLWAEGAYRFNLVQASVVTAGGATQACRASDDEVLGRVGYRYPLPGWLPRVGVSVGVASERTSFDCGTSALATSYGSTELQLKVLEPLLGETLALELAGGPRFLFTTRAKGYDTLAFSAEGWLTARLGRYFTGRAGARVTGTKLTTYPEGVSLFDLRTFVGLEVGAAL
jgi:hypothetical protein